MDTALVWTNKPTGGSIDEGSHRFYLFRENADSAYTGAVYDMVADIHVVVLPKHRRRGMAKRMMLEVVLSHLRSIGRGIQHTKLCSEEGRSLALSLGFSEIGNDTAKISLTRFGPWTHLQNRTAPI